MISGAHAIIYSADAEADRAFTRDVLELPSVDAGGGWLIFGLPPSELAFHPAENGGRHEVYLLCDDIHAMVRELEAKNVKFSAISDEGWGLVTRIDLPSGTQIGVYQPRHPTAAAPQQSAE